jgi:hypothetical protein
MNIEDTTQAKSDQLTADDFIGKGPMTITITNVVMKKDPQQPVVINYEGDNGKPYKPGLSMRRVLVHVWNKDTTAYVGRKLTLYRDPTVKMGGLVVGGIRISHMSNINQTTIIALTVTKGVKKAWTVEPLLEAPKPKPVLNPSYKGWEKAKAALKAGETTIEKLRESFELSEENEALIKAEEGAK